MQRFIGKYSKQQQKQIEQVSKTTGLGNIVAELVLDRGFDPETFFAKGEYHDPFLLHDMDKAVKCIRKHLKDQSVITIFGDYDVDGVSASAILYLYLRSVGAFVHVILPSRQEDGYGLNTELLQRAIDNGSKLVITVDCGISSFEEAKFCKENKLDLVITDHHQVGSKLPDCAAVVDPLLGQYPTPQLCGAGVAGKLVQALSGQPAMEQYLDLMALATIADIVPLTGENRTIVKNGLERMRKETRTGLLALKEVAGIHGEIEVGNIAFGIAPRLNAAGRIATAMDAFHLLVAEDYDVALQLARNIDITNRLRQKQEEQIMNAAVEMVDQQVDLSTDRVIMLKNEQWNKGVIGIVASKLVEKYHRPVILFAEQDGLLTGSGRSVHGVHLYQLIRVGDSLLQKYGGHELAAGMSLESAKLPEFQKTLAAHLEHNADAELFVPKEYYDLEIKVRQIDLKLVEDLERLAPLGMGNKTPAFLLRNVALGGLKLIGENKDHLRFSLADGSKSVSGVGFSKGYLLDELEKHQKYDVIVNVERNSWQGRETAQVQLRAIKPNVEDNIEFITDIGANAFVDSVMSMPKQMGKVNPGRMRKMWRGDVYISRRVKKDVFGTAIYTTVPACTKHLLHMLKTQGLLTNLDVCFGTPENNTCLVVCPDWTVTDIPHKRLVLNDYAPTGFVEKVMQNNPELQVVLCHNGDREQMILEFTRSMALDRNQLLRYYSTIRQYCSVPTPKPQLLAKSEQPYRLAMILQVFADLGLIVEEEGVIAVNGGGEKQQLQTSAAYQAMLGLDDAIGKEIKLLLDASNK